ncbi:MAG: hypothetical protein COB07_01035 [Sulfurovum sp.]|nr:MAG: hypothetical protein COB07_01035 [Sulfurovum sp.]
MKNITLLSLVAVALLFTACVETENKNHTPFEPTTQTVEQKNALKKLAKEAEANYEAKKKNSTH